MRPLAHTAQSFQTVSHQASSYTAAPAAATAWPAAQPYSSSSSSSNYNVASTANAGSGLTPLRFAVAAAQPLAYPSASVATHAPAAVPQQHPVQLAAGWVELRDPQGRAYYYNSYSGQTTWQRPAGV